MNNDEYNNLQVQHAIHGKNSFFKVRPLQTASYDLLQAEVNQRRGCHGRAVNAMPSWLGRRHKLKGKMSQVQVELRAF